MIKIRIDSIRSKIRSFKLISRNKDIPKKEPHISSKGDCKEEIHRVLHRIQDDFYHKALCYKIYRYIFSNDLREDNYKSLLSEYQKITSAPYINWNIYFEKFAEKYTEITESIACKLENFNYVEHEDKNCLTRFELYLLNKAEKNAKNIILKAQNNRPIND